MLGMRSSALPCSRGLNVRRPKPSGVQLCRVASREAQQKSQNSTESHFALQTKRDGATSSPDTVHISALDANAVSTADATRANAQADAILQQLEPLDVKLLIESIDEEPEEVIKVATKEVTYQRPKKHRRSPGNMWVLAGRNFVAEVKGIIIYLLEKLAKPDEDPMPACFNFTLSNEAIHEFDVAHPPPGREPIPFFIKLMYDILLVFVDRVYEGKAIERFWFLETVARMPYFSYTTVLHLYETLGWWRTGGLRLVHFAEEWNELHHLLIMEALGGDRQWTDRFLGQHCAVFYYWALVVAFLISPKWSYKFSEMLETHAVSTYRQFIIENAAQLKQLPAPMVAKRYYLSDDPYLYNMDSGLVRGISNTPPRTPPCETLYDVFVNILEDEWEHVKTMCACQDYDLLETLKVSQSTFTPDASDAKKRRELWDQWAQDIAKMDRMIELRAWETRKQP